MISNSDAALGVLLEDRAQAKQHSASWKKIEKALDVQISEIINPEGVLREAKKLENGGSKSIKQAGSKIEVEAKKEVKWDNTQLQNIASAMPWQSVVQLFKIDFEMKESVYKGIQDSVKAGLQDPDFLNKLNVARTVKIGEPKIKSIKLLD